MKYYRHYKNKPYKILGEVRHSETLEALVLYECRYPNETAKTWVRPKEMYHGTTTVNGQEVRRFAPIALDIQRQENITPQDLNTVETLCRRIFMDFSAERLHERLKKYPKSVLWIGVVENQPVAFKWGYETLPGVFESWLGGVHPDFRDLGIAGDLMKAQHQWAKEKGFDTIKTKTMNQWKDMMILNLRHGFKITGTESSERGLKILMEKKL